MVSFTIDNLDKLLQKLEGLPKIREITDLIKRLEKEKEKLGAGAPTVASTPTGEEITTRANISRSNRLQRYWRYVKLIRDNFPNVTVKEIRKQLTQRQQGKKTKIPDAIWQNPSP